MKKILITGANSYIGTSFERFLSVHPDEYQVDTIDMYGGAWQQKRFIGYDCIVHVAGIAHVSTKNMAELEQKTYWEINALLPIEVAKKAANESVKQFIFLSSMSVYGEIGRMTPPIIITRETQTNPNDIYGKSKLCAEKGILQLEKTGFRTCILRPPMIYGPGARGNYNSLKKIADKLPVFPNVKNQRSMLHIDKLCETLKDLIDHEKAGLFFPQDDKYVCTAEIVKKLAKDKGKDIRLSSVLNPAIYLLAKVPGVLGEKTNKAFGSLVYDMSMSR